MGALVFSAATVNRGNKISTMVKILTLTNVIGQGRTGDCTLYRGAFSFAKGRNTGSEGYVSVALPRNLFEHAAKGRGPRPRLQGLGLLCGVSSTSFGLNKTLIIHPQVSSAHMTLPVVAIPALQIAAMAV